MLRDSQDRLEGLIVELLAQRPGANASWLHEQLNTKYRSCTLQAVYQELRKLRKSGVVVKIKDRFSLRIAWVLQMMELSDTMYDNYLCRPESEELFPEKGEKRSWQLPDLYSVGAFCSQLVVSTIQHSGEANCFEYTPHAWYHLCPGPNEEQFLQALSLKKCRYYLVIGGDTYLDHEYKVWFEKIDGEISFGHTIKESLKEQAFFTCGDFVGSIQLRPSMRRKIEALFSSVSCQKELEVGEVLSLFRERTKCKVTLSNDPEKARLLRRRFMKFFGITESSG